MSVFTVQIRFLPFVVCDGLSYDEISRVQIWNFSLFVQVQKSSVSRQKW